MTRTELRRNEVRRNDVKRHGLRRARLLTLVLISMWAGGHAAAQQPTFRDELADKLVGDWVMTGTIAGHPTTHDIHAEWVMNHQYVRIHETSRERNAAGEPAYDAFVFIGWNVRLKQYACVWLDVYGGASPESIAYADPDKDKMMFLFKAPDEDFHTTFAYDEQTHSWKMTMDAEKKEEKTGETKETTAGTLKPFARTVMTSADKAAGVR